MSCQNHPNKESIANCQFCGKELCEDCAISLAGKNYCEECMSDLVGPELTNIARKTPDSETQNDVMPNQSHFKEEETQPPIIEKETPIIKEKEQEIPSKNFKNTNENVDDFKNTNNLDDNRHNDIYNDDRLYNDIHGNESSPTSPSNEKIEEKYEKYLDDLYFDEKPKIQENRTINRDEKISLSEQLAQDEATHVSITQEPFVPERQQVENQLETNLNESDKNKNVPIMENLRNVNTNEENEERRYTTSSLHKGSIHYKKEEKTPFTSIEKILTIILILLIILVVMYVIYLLTLYDNYPSVIQAISAFFGNPGEVINQMFN